MTNDYRRGLFVSRTAGELLDRWLDEAEAVEGAEQAGVVQAAWKDVSEPVIYPVLKIEAENALDAHSKLFEGFKSFPMGQGTGERHLVER